MFIQGIGNGIPLGAVVTTPEIAQVLTRRCYFNTFGGNPLCTAGGLAVLKVLEKEKLQENAFVVGSYLKDRLRVLQEKHDSEFWASRRSDRSSWFHIKFERSIFLITIPLYCWFSSILAVIGDVRGTGFMLGVELVTDRQLKTPANDEICHAMEHMKGNVSTDRGIAQ
jgi:alanine-glyoxylate transaminase/(R)-3-amino-2-methylpropionate-pyruvate transaminase